MAEHNGLTEKLNERQRADLAADITRLSEEEYADAGIPQVRFVAADSASDGMYPSYKAMANSWNKELFKKAWQYIAGGCRDDAEVIVSPEAGTGVTPYSECAAEDPCLAGVLSASFAAGVKKAGLTPCISCGIPAADAAYMDGTQRERTLNELYLSTWGEIPAGTAFTFPYGNDKEYRKRLSGYLHERNAGAVICSGVPEDKLEECINGGAMVYGGTVSEEGALNAGVTESAVQRAAGFAQAAAQKGEYSYPDPDKEEKTALNMAEQSCVLLKNNDGILPLKNGADIVVLGGLSEDVNAQSLCDIFKQTGKYMAIRRTGYELDGSIDTDLTDEGAQAAFGSKYAIVFLGFSPRAGKKSMAQKRAKLPAVQLALLDKLAARHTKIIAVVGADYPVDLSFDGMAEAIIVSPSTGKFTAQALYNIMTGKVSPSGRLAQTWYRNADDEFRLLKNEIAAGARRTGIFSGYRGYAPGEGQPYPFGHGLSYTDFEYSALTIKSNEIKFRVKNKGQYAAGEIVQVYIGKNDSAIVRPQLQLKAFIRVYLKSGESTECTVKCSPKTFEVYNGGGFVTERGKYSVYIGSSSCDIRLKGSIYSGGNKLKPDEEKASLYDTSQSNILDGGFTFGKVFKQKTFGSKPYKLGICLAIAVIFAVLILGTLQIGGYINFAYMDWWAKFGIISVVSVASAALFFILIGGIALMISKSKKMVLSTGDSGATGEAEPAAYEQLFSQLYGPEEYDEYDDYEDYGGYRESRKEQPTAARQEKLPDMPAMAAAEEKQPVIEEPRFRGKYDAAITYDDLCSWLNAFTESKGISIGKTGARKVLSVFAASRLVIIGGQVRSSEGFAEALSEYFTGTAYNCNLAECGEGGILADESFISALHQAEENPDDMVLVTLSGADDGTAAHILPFIRCGYAKGITRVNEDGYSADIPANMWFVIIPSADMFTFSDKLLCRVSAVLITELTRCEARYAGEYQKLNFEQFRSMTDRIIAYDDEYRYSLDEEHCWKRIDAVEKYLNGASGYVLDNRDCLSMERYSAVYLACGGEQNDALDSVTAVKLVLPAMQALKAADVKEDDFVSLIENKFVDYSDIKKVINYLR